MRLAAHARHVPAARLPVEACIAAAGAPHAEAKAFRRIFGIAAVPVCDDAAGDCTAMLGNALTLLLDDLAAAPDTLAPEVLILANANPVQAPVMAEAAAALRRTHPLLAGVGQVIGMDQHCCATLFWALQAALTMLAAGQARSVLVLAGDSFAGLPLEERYLPACTVLGDAFAGLVLDNRRSGAQIDQIVLQSNPEFHFGLYGSPEQIHQFNRDQAQLVTEVLSALSPGATEDEPILPHNINSFFWDQFCAATDTPRERIWLDLLADHGHCCSTDAFLNLDRLFASAQADSAVLVAVGQGGFVAACRLRKPVLEVLHAAH